MLLPRHPGSAWQQAMHRSCSAHHDPLLLCPGLACVHPWHAVLAEAGPLPSSGRQLHEVHARVHLRPELLRGRLLLQLGHRIGRAGPTHTPIERAVVHALCAPSGQRKARCYGQGPDPCCCAVAAPRHPSPSLVVPPMQCYEPGCSDVVTGCDTCHTGDFYGIPGMTICDSCWPNGTSACPEWHSARPSRLEPLPLSTGSMPLTATSPNSTSLAGTLDTSINQVRQPRPPDALPTNPSSQRLHAARRSLSLWAAHPRVWQRCCHEGHSSPCAHQLTG